MIGEPAQEEGGNESSHDFEGFGGPGHLIGPQSHDNDRVAHKDEEEWQHKATNKPAYCNGLVDVMDRCVIGHTNSPPQMSSGATEHHGGCAQSDREQPGQQDHGRGLLYGTMVLSPHWKHDRHAAVNTDDDEEEDAAEHVDEHHRGGELAHEDPKDPGFRCCLCDVEGQTGAEQEVRDGQTEVPGGVDRLLHLETGNPDYQRVTTNPQQTDHHVEHQQCGA